MAGSLRRFARQIRRRLVPACCNTLPSTWLTGDQAIILHFGAVDYFAEVWFNDVYLGSHEGGYLPFQFDVQPHLREENEILVRVVDPSDNPRQYPDYPFSEIPARQTELVWANQRLVAIRLAGMPPDAPHPGVAFDARSYVRGR